LPEELGHPLRTNEAFIQFRKRVKRCPRQLHVLLRHRLRSIPWAAVARVGLGHFCFSRRAEAAALPEQPGGFDAGRDENGVSTGCSDPALHPTHGLNSRVPVLLHPSPSTAFPSSHCSLFWTIPSPAIGFMTTCRQTVSATPSR
jgi:hypothetical protein